MNWISSSLERLVQQPICGYIPGQSPASEPTALAALALTGSSLHTPAQKAAEWLADLQTEEGSISVRPGAEKPRWPTALAVLTWQVVGGTPNRFERQIERALAWSLSLFGARFKPNVDVGHRCMLSAWPWVEGTHSWVEPTALQVLALRASGLGKHPRTREARELLIDRQLPAGGCNAGNTIVLGQAMRPHVQPTGLAMLALAGERDAGGVIDRSLSYLENALSEETTPTSLCWGLMGLTAHDRRPAGADDWLSKAAARAEHRRFSLNDQALLVLASLGEMSPLMPSFAGSATHSPVSSS